jgi:hypothetical protein
MVHINTSYTDIFPDIQLAVGGMVEVEFGWMSVYEVFM